jgi:DNA-binding NarL/FixJ family response regulator
MDQNKNEMESKIAGCISAHENRIVRLRLRGFKQSEIAHQLHIEECTVHTHLQRIYEKTGVTDMVGLFHWYFEQVECMNLMNYLV